MGVCTPMWWSPGGSTTEMRAQKGGPPASSRERCLAGLTALADTLHVDVAAAEPVPGPRVPHPLAFAPADEGPDWAKSKRLLMSAERWVQSSLGGGAARPNRSC